MHTGHDVDIFSTTFRSMITTMCFIASQILLFIVAPRYNPTNCIVQQMDNCQPFMYYGIIGIAALCLIVACVFFAKCFWENPLATLKLNMKQDKRNVIRKQQLRTDADHFTA